MDRQWWVRPEDLDDDQRKVVSLPRDGSYVVLGPPGSGKTNLLLLRGSYLVRAGFPNIALIVFGRTLQEFLAAGARNYAFDPAKVRTSMKLFETILAEGGITPPRCDDFKEQRKALLTSLEGYLEDQGIENLFSDLLVDEVQDYTPRELQVLRRLANRVYAVGDSMQQIYVPGSTRQDMAGAFDRVLTLRFHYRTGLNICRVADSLGQARKGYISIAATCNYDEALRPSSVKVLQCRNLGVQCESMMNSVATQLRAYPDELIGVVVPENSDLERIRGIMASSSLRDRMTVQSSREGYVPFEVGKEVCLCTLHGAKGLEFRAMHILAADSIQKFRLQRNLMFVGVTRARTSLHVYYSGSIPGYLQEALEPERGSRGEPRIEDLFRGGSDDLRGG